MFTLFVIKLALVGLVLVLIARIGLYVGNASSTPCLRRNKDREDSCRILNHKLDKGEIEREEYEEIRKVLDSNLKK